MSITLNDLLEWRDRLPEQSGEEAHMVRALIARREAELRTRIADSIAMASQRENWKLQRCAAIARRVEQAPVGQLESVYTYFQNRSEGRLDIETPAMLSEFFAGERIEHKGLRVSAQAPAVAPLLDHLYGNMVSLESSVASTPGMACGIQGIRIMRMVALMSKARSAQIAKMRMTGAQAYYRHS
ncbi:hypothetical protein AWB70_00944 [Caballeronia cordobensis]|uniref:Uncharacterized protein n=1 Tax=Caballeronia cordobensis TaxID=1353886 RepID=A0A158FJ73_CABCO|nr:hypothetical protein [Caballeronia cordobensis]SAL19389.1 hypothetical protein AWB70_00944 [Caballeronia cordobensis]